MSKFVIYDIKHDDYLADIKEEKPLHFIASFCRAAKNAIKFKTRKSAEKALILVNAISDDDEFDIIEVKSK